MDQFIGFDNQLVTVEAIRDTQNYERVYNVSVSEWHTYFIGKEDWGWSIWGHNAAPYRDNVYPDPEKPSYNNGATHIDHSRARSLGGTNDASNLRPLPAETNLRKGGFEGALNRDIEKYRSAGLTDQQIEEILKDELNALANSPPPRPIDPQILDLFAE